MMLWLSGNAWKPVRRTECGRTVIVRWPERWAECDCGTKIDARAERVGMG
jgi:hypothetical protein